MTRLLPLSLLLAIGAAHAAPTPITLEQAMAEPDWIGNPVESAWWAWDSRNVQYTIKRDGSPVRDTWQMDVGAPASAAVVADAQRGNLDTAARIYNASRSQMAFVRDGNVFVRDLRSGALTQVTHGDASARGLAFAGDNGLVWHSGHTWYHFDGSRTRQVASLKAEKDPDAAPRADSLREQQLSTLETLRRDRANRQALSAQAAAWRAADPTRPSAPSIWAMRSPSSTARCRRTCATCWCPPAARRPKPARAARCRCT